MKKPLKILFLIPDLGKGGAERFLLDLCHELLKDKNFEICIATLYERNQFTSLSAGLPIVSLNYEPFRVRNRNDQPAYRKLLDEFQPDIIHTHRFLAEFMSSYYVSDSFVYVCHGHDNMRQFRNFRLNFLFNRKKMLTFYEKRHLLMYKYRKAECYFTCNSRNTVDYFKSVLPSYLQDHIRLMENGFNYARFFDPAEKELPGKDEPIRLINVGSFQKKKNQTFLIDIALELKKRGRSFELHLVGDGKELNKVIAKAGNIGISYHVFFHGNVERVEELLHRSHIYLHTAWYEPFGLVLLEAMASGLPCITLDGKGDKDLMRNGENGFFIETENAELFAQKIESLASDPDQYRSISNFCKTFAENYDMTKKAEEWKAFYFDVVEKRRQRA